MDEPRGMTLTDLVVLVAGGAIAMGAGWFSFGAGSGAGRGRFPEWFAWLSVANEVEWKALMALVPVVLARRIRFGGGLSAPEFAAVVAGSHWAMMMLYRWPPLGIVYRDPDFPSQFLVWPTGMNLWYLAKFAIGALSLLAIWLGRSRLSALAISLLLALVWQLDACLNFALNMARDAWLAGVAWESVPGRLIQTALMLPNAVAGWQPILVALIAFTARGRRRATWVERAVVGFGALRFGGLLITNATNTYARKDSVVFAVGLGSDLVKLAVALGLAFWIARRLGPERLWGERREAGA